MAIIDEQPTLPDVNDLLPSEPCRDDNQVADADSFNEYGTDHQAASTTAINNGPPQGMSKSALKKLRKRQEWEAGREDRKAKKKELRKAKQEKRKEAKANGEVVAKSAKQQQPTVQTQVPITLVLDCSFDSLMTEAEHISLCGQINRCYHDVRNGRFRPVLAVTSFGGRMKDRFDSVLQAHYKRWKGVHFVEQHMYEISKLATSWMKNNVSNKCNEALDPPNAAKGSTEDISGQPARLIYLSADSPDVLTTLEPNTCYIIGGLVDRNRHKGVCYEAAQKANIPTARLPIGEYIKLSSRQVLTTNHVVEIMVKYMENRDWAKSFLEVIPTRKGVGSKDNANDDNSAAGAPYVDDNAEVEREELEQTSPPRSNTED